MAPTQLQHTVVGLTGDAALDCFHLKLEKNDILKLSWPPPWPLVEPSCKKKKKKRAQNRQGASSRVLRNRQWPFLRIKRQERDEALIWKHPLFSTFLHYLISPPGLQMETHNSESYHTSRESIKSGVNEKKKSHFLWRLLLSQHRRAHDDQ